MKLNVTDAQIATLVRHAANLDATEVKVFFDDSGLTLLGMVNGEKVNLGEVFMSHDGFQVVNLF